VLLETTVGVCKKVGQPNFGSVGAHADIKVMLNSSDPAEVSAEIARAYAIVESVVAAELARLTGEVPSAPPAPSLGAQTAVNGRQAPRHSYGGKGEPQNGRQFYGYLKDQEKDGAAGLVKHIEQWAKREGIPGRIVEWSTDVVSEAIAVAQSYLEGPAVNGRV
jgi:hypothetical protein